MRIVISSGHGKYIRGASGYIDEVDEARLVVEDTAAALRRLGVETTTYHDDVSDDQSENLNRIVDFHNSKQRDLDVSVHFNASKTTSSPVGTECWYVSQKDLAAKVATAIATTSGLKDRGPKYSNGLFFLNNTAKPSVLVEVCFVDSKADCDIYQRQYSNICDSLGAALAGQEAKPPGPTPPERPEKPEKPPEVASRPTLKKGSTGPDVIALQKSLGVLIADGDFGGVTDTWVKAFQAACGLSADGIVGPMTWDEVDDLDDRVKESPPLLSRQLTDAIYTAAQQSEIADYSWPDRGVPPPGYIAGLSLCFAFTLLQAEDGRDAAKAMTKELGGEDVDALARFKDHLTKQGYKLNSWDARLRALFGVMISLGPRESNGRYFEGRDMSAENVQSDTCEAGLFQTSWDIKPAHSSIGPMLNQFWSYPVGFLEVFKEGLSPSANNLNSYGSGDGIKYQWLSRFAPLFHVAVTGVGMRYRCQHWGPLKRYEITIKKEAETLLKEVQALVESHV